MYISTCQIPKGSEIFIDYGDEFWKVHNENVDSNVDEPLRAADTTTSNPVAEQSAAEVDELTVRVAPDSNARCGTIDTMPWNDESLCIDTEVEHCAEPAAQHNAAAAQEMVEAQWDHALESQPLVSERQGEELTPVEESFVAEPAKVVAEEVGGSAAVEGSAATTDCEQDSLRDLAQLQAKVILNPPLNLD